MEPRQDSPSRFSSRTQVVLWVVALIVAVLGMIDPGPVWDPNLATIQFVLLLFAIPCFGIRSDQSNSKAGIRNTALSHAADARYSPIWQKLAVALGWAIVTYAMHVAVGRDLAGLPPAYHDEFSYRFQARTLLQGRDWTPSHPTMPELFDQVHVLNEGRMASRYYPGTGAWLAPFEAFEAIHHGPYAAGAIATFFFVLCAWELGGLRVAMLAGGLLAFSPAITVFGTLLLSHHPTLVGIALFLWGFLKFRTQPVFGWGAVSGLGLAYAMLCRPATAAAIGLPFGLVLLRWWITGRGLDEPAEAHSESTPAQTIRSRTLSLMGWGCLLAAGWGVMLAHNAAITGDWRLSPYQQYTQIYTPRHVYGFGNGVRGIASRGPKTLERYDDWAENLTLPLAFQNTFTRLLTSLVWTSDPILLIVTMAGAGATWSLGGRPLWLLWMAVLMLYAVHFPYWYSGIMGWHYVFESSVLLLLLAACLTGGLLTAWQQQGRPVMPFWLAVFAFVSAAGAYISIPGVADGRVNAVLASIAFSKQKYAIAQATVDAAHIDRPALVLVRHDDAEFHIDYIDNVPGLSAEVLWGRYRAGETDLPAVEAMFSDRTVYVFNMKDQSLDRVSRRKQ